MSYFLNTDEIVQTIRMIEQEHLDVRTITLGLSLLDCATGDIKRTAEKVYEKICREAHDLVPVGEAIEREFGIPIVNKRVSVTPVALIAGGCGDDLVPIAEAMDRAAREVSVNFIGGFSVITPAAVNEIIFTPILKQDGLSFPYVQNFQAQGVQSGNEHRSCNCRRKHYCTGKGKHRKMLPIKEICCHQEIDTSQPNDDEFTLGINGGKGNPAENFRRPEQQLNGIGQQAGKHTASTGYHSAQ